MGSHSMQAVGLVTFLLAFVIVTAGLALDKNAILMLVGAVLLAVSAFIFYRCKAVEGADS